MFGEGSAQVVRLMSRAAPAMVGSLVSCIHLIHRVDELMVHFPKHLQSNPLLPHSSINLIQRPRVDDHLRRKGNSLGNTGRRCKCIQQRERVELFILDCFSKVLRSEANDCRKRKPDAIDLYIRTRTYRASVLADMRMVPRIAMYSPKCRDCQVRNVT
jgi:hypothetical protein